jgi:hypothetical protein
MTDLTEFFPPVPAGETLPTIEEDGQKFYLAGDGDNPQRFFMFDTPDQLYLFQPGSIQNKDLIEALVQQGSIESPKDASKLIGKFIFKKTGIILDELTCVPIIEIAKPRAYYEKAYADGDSGSPDCFSENGIVPSQFVEIPQNPVCMTQDATGRWKDACPKAQWVEKKCACPRSSVIGFFEVDYGIVFSYKITGKNHTVWSTFVRKYKSQIAGAKTLAGLKAAMGDKIKLPGSKGGALDPSQVLKIESANLGMRVALKLRAERKAGFDIATIAPLLDYYSKALFTQAAQPKPEELAAGVDTVAMIEIPAETIQAEGFTL